MSPMHLTQELVCLGSAWQLVPVLTLCCHQLQGFSFFIEHQWSARHGGCAVTSHSRWGHTFLSSGSIQVLHWLLGRAREKDSFLQARALPGSLVVFLITPLLSLALLLSLASDLLQGVLTRSQISASPGRSPNRFRAGSEGLPCLQRTRAKVVLACPHF